MNWGPSWSEFACPFRMYEWWIMTACTMIRIVKVQHTCCWCGAFAATILMHSGRYHNGSLNECLDSRVEAGVQGRRKRTLYSCGQTKPTNLVIDFSGLPKYPETVGRNGVNVLREPIFRNQFVCEALLKFFILQYIGAAQNNLLKYANRLLFVNVLLRSSEFRSVVRFSLKNLVPEIFNLLTLFVRNCTLDARAFISTLPEYLCWGHAIFVFVRYVLIESQQTALKNKIWLEE